ASSRERIRGAEKGTQLERKRGRSSIRQFVLSSCVPFCFPASLREEKLSCGLDLRCSLGWLLLSAASPGVGCWPHLPSGNAVKPYEEWPNDFCSAPSTGLATTKQPTRKAPRAAVVAARRTTTSGGGDRRAAVADPQG